MYFKPDYNNLINAPLHGDRMEVSMKLMTAVIPCYNSAAYMNHAIDTLLSGGEEIEILIVNDGSTDDTQKIAEEYQAKHPSVIRVINQENGGHGEAVIPGWPMLSGCILRWLTVMTG